MKTLWCKNQENPSDQISHAWAPLSCSVGPRRHAKKGKNNIFYSFMHSWRACKSFAEVYAVIFSAIGHYKPTLVWILIHSTVLHLEAAFGKYA